MFVEKLAFRMTRSLIKLGKPVRIRIGNVLKSYFQIWLNFIQNHRKDILVWALYARNSMISMLQLLCLKKL